MRRAVSAAIAAALVAGCSSGPDLGPRFDDEGAAAVTCMKHQPEPPGPRYADPAARSTADALAVLRYYTAHAGKGYCDGAGPTDVDRAWARTYVDLGADRTVVAQLLD